MQTFQITLSETTWTEIGFGYNLVAFDAIEANPGIEVYFTDTAADPGDVSGNPVRSWGPGWDFSATGLEIDRQRLWVRGRGDIRGVRDQ